MRSTPSRSALPLAATAPISPRNNVVLLAPLRPIRPHMARSHTSSDASRTIATGPIATLRFSTLSIGHRNRLTDPRAANQGQNLGVGESLLRRTVGNHRSVVEGKHAVGKAGDDFHIVLDEQDRDPAGLQGRYHHAHDVIFLFDGDAARWFVEQE